jgi:hypothetical protein
MTAMLEFLAVCAFASLTGWAALRVARYLAALDMPDDDGERM